MQAPLSITARTPARAQAEERSGGEPARTLGGREQPAAVARSLSNSLWFPLWVPLWAPLRVPLWAPLWATLWATLWVPLSVPLWVPLSLGLYPLGALARPLSLDRCPCTALPVAISPVRSTGTLSWATHAGPLSWARGIAHPSPPRAALDLRCRHGRLLPSSPRRNPPPPTASDRRRGDAVSPRRAAAAAPRRGRANVRGTTGAARRPRAAPPLPH